MAFWRMLVCLCVCFCSCSIPKDRVNITIINRGKETMKIRARASIFSTSIEVKPGESWVGWVPLMFAKDIRVEFEPKSEDGKPKKNKKSK